MLAMIAFFSGFVIFFAMALGQLIGEIISAHFLSTFAGLLMIGLGIYNLFNELPLYRRSFFVMITLLMNVDSFGYGIQAGIANQPYWLAPLGGFFIGFTLMVGIIYGHITENKLIMQTVETLPGILFIILGASKLFF